MRSIPLIVAVLTTVLLGCGAKTPVTEWYYSSWISEDGVAAEASFKEARETCLAQSGIADPAAVVVGSEKEREFVECMNAARWCTVAHGCD